MTACNPFAPDEPEYPSRSRAEVETSLDGTVDAVLGYLATVDPTTSSVMEKDGEGPWCDVRSNAIKYKSASHYVDTELPGNDLDATEQAVLAITSDTGFTEQRTVATGEHTRFWEFYNEFGDAIWVYVHPNRVYVSGDGACYIPTDFTPTLPSGPVPQRPTSPLSTPSSEAPPTG